jgi:transcriptional regulator with XRE-family HTH domain
MNDQESIRCMLTKLREVAGLTQAQLADRLSMTPSRLSRLESGDTELTRDEALHIAKQIPGPTAAAYAIYLTTEWRITEQPGFNHPNREQLWKAEAALQRLQILEDDPEMKNAFLQQIKSLRMALERVTKQLRSTDHQIILIGPPEVGKTTVGCELAGLRRADADLDLDDQMALQTGGGRVTISEVHMRNGGDFTVSVDPCTVEEVHQFVGELCDDLLRTLTKQDGETGGISAEVERAIRNMSKLTIRRPKHSDGRMQSEDLALELAREFPTKKDLLVQILTRMDLPRRISTSITYPRDATISGLDWVAKTAGEINYGRHPDFSLPRRVEITVPTRVLGVDDLDIRIIDTRGVDEPSAPRRDLQAYLDDDRCLVVFCSKFGDAPTGASLAVMERAINGGLRDGLLHRGLLLVLPRGDEDLRVRDNSTAQRVSTSEEGRAIRLDQIKTTLLHHKLQEMPVQFLNVRVKADCEDLRKEIVNRILEMRRRKEVEIEVLVSSIERLIANKKTEETRAVFYAATKALRLWFSRNVELPSATDGSHESLVQEMARLRYVTSLRASVNRKGSWYNFNYWHGLGFGTRTQTVQRTTDQVDELKVLINAALHDKEYAPVHDFLKFFLSEVEKSIAELYKKAQTLGETAFETELSADFNYWLRCQNRWGEGPGYRDDIKDWTSDWFDEDIRNKREEFIDVEVQKLWKQMLSELGEQISSKEQETIAEAPAILAAASA